MGDCFFMDSLTARAGSADGRAMEWTISGLGSATGRSDRCGPDRGFFAVMPVPGRRRRNIDRAAANRAMAAGGAISRKHNRRGRSAGGLDGVAVGIQNPVHDGDGSLRSGQRHIAGQLNVAAQFVIAVPVFRAR